MHNSINFYNSDNSIFKIKNKRLVIKWIIYIFFIEDMKAENISFIFCNDSFLLNLNKTYLKHNTFTDIITFDYSEGEIISGDIFINLDRVIENALNYKISFDKEVFRVMAHGILHLIGYTDKTKTERLDMKAKEDECLELWLKINKRST